MRRPSPADRARVRLWVLPCAVLPAVASARSPRQVAEQLAAVYGKKLDQVAYIPALPLVAKLRLSELTGEPKYREEVDKIVAPFLRGDKSPVPKSGSEQAGHLIFAELAARAEGKGPRTLDRCCAATRPTRSSTRTASRCRSCPFTTR